jgi:predicted lipoprotein
MQRREFLQQSASLALALAAVAAAGCRRPASRESVLSGIVRSVLMPDTNAIVQASRTLDESTARFTRAPTEPALLEARAAFRTALVRWKRGTCVLKGPLFDSGALFRATFWPTRIAAIDELIASSGAIDDARIDELAVDLKGLHALEYLLFGADKVDASVPPRFSGEHADRARRLTAALAANVRKLSQVAAKALGDGDSFVHDLEKDPQASINYLVNQMARTAEDVAHKLRSVLDHAARADLKARDVQGWASGTSTKIIETLVQGTEALYRSGTGGGLVELVTPVAPQIDPQIREAFAGARHALKELGGPVEVASQNQRSALEGAERSCKALEVSLKVNLASALGVTLTFGFGDGD